MVVFLWRYPPCFIPFKLAFVWFLCLFPEYSRGCCLFALVRHNDRLGALRGERGSGGGCQRDGKGSPPGSQWEVEGLVTDSTHPQRNPIMLSHFTKDLWSLDWSLCSWLGVALWSEGSDWLDIMILQGTSGQQQPPTLQHHENLISP